MSSYGVTAAGGSSGLEGAADAGRWVGAGRSREGALGARCSRGSVIVGASRGVRMVVAVGRGQVQSLCRGKPNRGSRSRGAGRLPLPTATAACDHSPDPRVSMDRRRFLRGLAVAGTGAFAAPMLNLGRCRLFAEEGSAPPLAGKPASGVRTATPALTVSVRAADLVQRVAVIDMLGLLTLDWAKLDRWQRDEHAFGESEFRRLERSGVTLFHPAVDPNQRDASAAVQRWMEGWDRLLAAHPRYFQRIDSLADLDRAKRERRLGLLLGFQNSDHFTRLADIARFHQLGQRVSQLTYDRTNRLGGGCREPDLGLTLFGAEVVGAMNEVGMAIDVSHCGERTTLDAFAASCKPVLVTHANCRALVPGHPRCKSDQVLRAMARMGGVIGITAVRAYVRQPEMPTVEDLLDHFEHVARVAGVEHVGLGSDVDVDALDARTGRVRPAYAIQGLDHARRVFALVEGLLRRGWRDEHVALALGGNFRRALGEIWAVAPPPGASAAV
jgi:membrane dipeptidase